MPGSIPAGRMATARMPGGSSKSNLLSFFASCVRHATRNLALINPEARARRDIGRIHLRNAGTAQQFQRTDDVGTENLKGALDPRIAGRRHAISIAAPQ